MSTGISLRVLKAAYLKETALDTKAISRGWLWCPVVFGSTADGLASWNYCHRQMHSHIKLMRFLIKHE